MGSASPRVWTAISWTSKRSLCGGRVTMFGCGGGRRFWGDGGKNEWRNITVYADAEVIDGVRWGFGSGPAGIKGDGRDGAVGGR
jgi:hypothetical protein